MSIAYSSPLTADRDVHAASQALRELNYAQDATIGDVEAISISDYEWPVPTVEIEDEPENPPELESGSETGE